MESVFISYSRLHIYDVKVVILARWLTILKLGVSLKYRRLLLVVYGSVFINQTYQGLTYEWFRSQIYKTFLITLPLAGVKVQTLQKITSA